MSKKTRHRTQDARRSRIRAEPLSEPRCMSVLKSVHLLSDLLSKDPHTRKKCAEKIIKTRLAANAKRLAIPELLGHLRTENDATRMNSAAVLFAIGDQEPTKKLAFSVLIEGLKDRDIDVRWHAAESLGMTRDATAVLPLVRALGDMSPAVKRAAARALVHMTKKGKQEARDAITVAIAPFMQGDKEFLAGAETNSSYFEYACNVCAFIMKIIQEKERMSAASIKS